MHKQFTTSVLVGLLSTTAVYADTLQFNLSVDVEQEVLPLVGDPGFEAIDPFDGSSQGFPFFDEWHRVLTEEANVWDQSQIIDTPFDGMPDRTLSQGTINASITFDASLLEQNLDGVTNPEGVVLGSSFEVATIQVFDNTGALIDGGITGEVEIVVADDLVVGVNGEKLDVLALVLVFPDEFPNPAGEEEDQNPTFLFGGDDMWFEDAAGGIPDFSRILEAEFEYMDFVYDTNDNILFEEQITGSIDKVQILGGLNNFGEADGSTESDPLLPDAPDTEDPNFDPAAPTFGFDLSQVVEVEGSGFVFIDPEIATGYTYAMDGDGEIVAIKAPSFDAVADSDGYMIELPNGQVFALAVDGSVDLLTGLDQDGAQILDKDGVPLALGAVTTFVLSGIDEALMIDPLDSTTFVIGLQFQNLGRNSSISQTATITNTDDPIDPPAVPLPPALALMLAGLGGLGLLKRRRSA